MYNTLQVIHVVAAVVWVGGAVFHIFASARLAGAPAGAAAWWGEVGTTAGKAYYMPAAIVTLLAGIGMVLVEDSLSFGEPFIGIGFGGIIVSIVLGAVLIERASGELHEAMAASPPDTARVEALTSRVRTLSVVDATVLLVVVWAMVVRPF